MITVGHPVAFAVGILGICMLTAGSFLEDAALFNFLTDY
jgi:hypothetical protein